MNRSFTISAQFLMNKRRKLIYTLITFTKFNILKISLKCENHPFMSSYLSFTTTTHFLCTSCTVFCFALKWLCNNSWRLIILSPFLLREGLLSLYSHVKKLFVRVLMQIIIFFNYVLHFMVPGLLIFFLWSNQTS